jgi:anti-sigma factor RsiW
VDQRLDPARRAQVEAYLEANPDAAEQVRVYREQNELLRAAFDGALEEPVPRHLQRVRAPRWSTPQYGAIAATLVIGVSVGWLIHGQVVPESRKIALSLPAQAAVAHVVYAPEVLHPVEVGADQQEHLVKWLSKRLNTPVRAPQLQDTGYQLEGGRLLPGSDGPAAQFMYRDVGGQRLTLYVRTKLKDNSDTAFRYAREGSVSVFYWVDHDVAYALSGELERERLLSVAEAVYHDLNR